VRGREAELAPTLVPAHDRPTHAVRASEDLARTAHVPRREQLAHPRARPAAHRGLGPDVVLDDVDLEAVLAPETDHRAEVPRLAPAVAPDPTRDTHASVEQAHER